MLVLVDTSALVAFLNKRDQNQERASRTLGILRKQASVFLIPMVVLFELIGHITRGGRDKSHRNAILDQFERLGWRFEVHSSTDYQEAVALWRKYADWPIEFPDCLIVATAMRLNADAVWTYDLETLGRILPTEARGIRVLGLETE